MFVLIPFLNIWNKKTNTTPQISASFIPNDWDTLRLILMYEFGEPPRVREIMEPLKDFERYYHQHVQPNENIFVNDNISSIELIPTDEFSWGNEFD